MSSSGAAAPSAAVATSLRDGGIPIAVPAAISSRGGGISAAVPAAPTPPAPDPSVAAGTAIGSE